MEMRGTCQFGHLLAVGAMSCEAALLRQARQPPRGQILRVGVIAVRRFFAQLERVIPNIQWALFADVERLVNPRDNLAFGVYDVNAISGLKFIAA